MMLKKREVEKFTSRFLFLSMIKKLSIKITLPNDEVEISLNAYMPYL